MPFTKEQLDNIVNTYKTEGFVIVDGLIPDELYEPLCKAADAVTDKARSGEWKNVRMVGKQFPPWADGGYQATIEPRTIDVAVADCRRRRLGMPEPHAP